MYLIGNLKKLQKYYDDSCYSTLKTILQMSLERDINNYCYNNTKVGILNEITYEFFCNSGSK